MLRHGIVEILLKLPLSINQSKQASKQAILKCLIYQTTETTLSQITISHLDAVLNMKL
jgi:flagellar assembly factor FliW